MTDDFKKIPEVSYLEEESLVEYSREVAFEKQFYSIIAGSDNFEVIPVPCMDGSYLTVEEKKSIASYAKANNKILLFRISLGNLAITFGEDGGLLGVSPEYNVHGFPC